MFDEDKSCNLSHVAQQYFLLVGESSSSNFEGYLSKEIRSLILTKKIVGGIQIRSPKLSEKKLRGLD